MRHEQTIQQRIQAELCAIERAERVQILLAVESGSRAWGFASPDSDYDVRFLYVRPSDAYLRLDRMRDVIEWKLDDVLDINGWDLGKALRLLHRSNPTLFEWLTSPIIYRKHPLAERLQAMMEAYFLAKPGLYHYLHMAKRNYRAFLQADSVRLKKYFYVLRPILACRHILAEGTPPPMLFDALVERYLPPAVSPHLEKLLAEKKKAPELGEGPRIPALNGYIEESFYALQVEIEALPGTRKEEWTDLNSLFLSATELSA